MATQTLSASNYLTLEIDKHLLEIPPVEAVLGRTGHPSEAQPDIDLDRFGAQDKGVSRRHVRIRYAKGAVFVTDLGSSYGTQLNGERLKSAAEYQLRDGDTLTLGVLSMTVRL